MMNAEAIVRAECRRLERLTDRELFALYALRTRDLGVRPMRRRSWKHLSRQARRDLTLFSVDGREAPLPSTS